MLDKVDTVKLQASHWHLFMLLMAFLYALSLPWYVVGLGLCGTVKNTILRFLKLCDELDLQHDMLQQTIVNYLMSTKCSQFKLLLMRLLIFA